VSALALALALALAAGWRLGLVELATEELESM
jgi:hypothetical protein